MALPIRIGALRALLKELQVSSHDARPLVVGGARELAPVLRKQLARGGRADAVRAGEDPEGAALLVYVLAREPDDADEAALKRARRARVPVVAVAAGPLPDDLAVPYVLATDIVRTAAGEGFPVEAIAERIAARLGEEGVHLAARIPVLRRAVCEQLVASFSRKNAVVAAAVFVPGADFPILTLNQLRLVLRIGAAYGERIEGERALEIGATLGAGLGLRTLARELLAFVPVAGWAVQGAVAYSGTRAVGEAAIRWFEARAGDAATTRSPAEASRDAP